MVDTIVRVIIFTLVPVCSVLLYELIKDFYSEDKDSDYCNHAFNMSPFYCDHCGIDIEDVDSEDKD